MSPVSVAKRRSRESSAVVRSIRKIDRDAYAFAAMRDELDLDSLVFNWISDRVPDSEAIGAITGVTVERTIEGASTVEVTLQDPDDRLFAGSRVWTPKPKKKQKAPRDYYGSRITTPDERGRAMEIKIDGIVFRLVKVSKSGTQSTLTFEDRSIYLLRRKRGSKRHKPRSKITRAQFILSLLREVKSERIRFVCPELNVKQPIGRATVAAASKTDSKTNTKSRGLSDADLTVKGRRATKENRRVGEKVLTVADELDAGEKATLALMEAVIVESEVTNTPKGHSSSVGVLQLLNLHGSVSRRMNIEWCVKKFLQDGFTGAGGAIKLARAHPSWSAGTVAWHVQGPAAQYRGRYDQVQREATEWVEAFGNGSAESNAAGGSTRYRSYQFAREKDEDSWTCIQRLAEEVGWRCFMQGRSLFYMSEADLFRRKPLYTLKPDDGSVLGFDYDIDWGKTVSEARVQVLAGEWQCPPGEPVLVSGYGPPDGRWLVTDWRRDYFSPIVDITLRQPGREGMEPPPETVTESATGSGGGDDVSLFSGPDTGDVPRAVLRAYNRAEAIDRKNQSYQWGGGHGSFNDPRGFDCSGFVSSCLHAGGMLSSPQSTSGLIGWGAAGHGKHMTVYVRETGDPHQSHTFIVFNVKGRQKWAEAGGGNSGHTGWHSARSTAGFSPRHYPGT